MEPPVLTEARDGWRLIRLNRPDRLNSFDGALHLALAAAIDTADADPTVRALLLTGAGRAFCAGQDLSDPDIAGAPPDLAGVIHRRWNPLIRRLRALRLPVVCAVNGTAAGAGASLALACDIVLAAKSASFVQAFAKVGLIPDSGATWTLPRLIGDARARALAMLADKLDAPTAAAWGMIWRCTDDADLMPEAEALTARLAAMPTHAFTLMKRAFAASAANTLSEQLDLERDLQQKAGRTPDYAEGVRAFAEKRAPVFTGRPG